MEQEADMEDEDSKKKKKDGGTRSDSWVISKQCPLFRILIYNALCASVEDSLIVLVGRIQYILFQNSRIFHS